MCKSCEGFVIHAMSQETKTLFEFGEFRFDAEKCVLWRRGEMVALAPKATDVLCLLIEARGDLVRREEIIEHVWNETFVEEGNLNHAVSALRKALGSDGIIQTVPRRGYRFVAEVRQVSARSSEEIIVEKQSLTETTIELTEQFSVADPAVSDRKAPIYVRWVPVIAALVIVVALVAWYRIAPKASDHSATVKQSKVLALLPLRPLSASDVDSEVFTAGMIENLASRLGRLEQLIVRPTSTSSRLAENGEDPIAIGRKLGADAILEGSYQRSDGRIRMVVRLLSVPSGAQLWTGNFDEKETDLFKLQDALVDQAANQLIDPLTHEQSAEIAKRITDDVEAFKLYNRGRYEWTKRTRVGFETSIAAFKQAIDRDPSFSLAYAGLADSYVLLADYFLEAPTIAFPKAKASAVKALELDPTSARARATLAYILATYDWNFPEAEQQYKIAIAAEPNYATVHQWYGEMLVSLHRFDEAEAELQIAAELDPLVPTSYSERAILLYYEGKFEESLSQLAILKKEHPQFPVSYIFSSFVYKLQGNDNRAYEEELMYWKLQGESEASLNKMSRQFDNGGLPAFLTTVGEKLEAEVVNGAPPSYKIVSTFARAGDKEKTLYWMEQCVKAHDPLIIKMAADRNFDFVRNDPRFQRALVTINYPH